MRRMALCVAGVALFIAGILVGPIVTSPAAAQENSAGVRLNHIGIAVNNFDESLKFYTEVMGFKKAYAFPPNPDGRPSTTFLQINKDTFIEMAPAGPNQPAGLTHMGLWTPDANATVALVRKNGGMATDARPSENSGSVLSNVTDPNKIRIELNQQPPASLMSKAMAAWK